MTEDPASAGPATGRWRRVCRVGEVPPGRPIGRAVGADRVCVVVRGDGTYLAVLDRCPHRDVALSGGIVKTGELVCPGHFWRFDLETGERTDLPEQRLRTYPTRVVDGWVEALVPEPVPRLPMREWLLARAREQAPH